MSEPKKTESFAGNVMKYSIATYLGFGISGAALIIKGVLPAESYAVMAGGMVPPLGVALAGTLFPERFTTKERHTAMTDYLMGACFITEGVVPFVLRDPLHVIPSCMAGASLAAALSMLFGCAVPAPHGGMFLLPLNPHPFRYLLALLMGSLLTAVTLAVLRRKYPPKDEEQPTN